jgi:hypothetical protein
MNKHKLYRDTIITSLLIQAFSSLNKSIGSK